MANYQLNKWVLGKQVRTLLLVGGCFLIVIAVILILLVDGRPKKSVSSKEAIDLTSIIDESFTQANADSALTTLQTEQDALKSQLDKLVQSINTMNTEHAKQRQAQAVEFQKQISSLTQQHQELIPQNEPANEVRLELKDVNNPQLWHNKTNTLGNHPAVAENISTIDIRPQIHAVSFRPKRRVKPTHFLSPAHYVPSNTSVRAVILGGADADASVNGQSKNNGVMLFKFLEDGTLPNGQHSHLKGCRVSANSYGDISSERAFATLYRLSCAHRGLPIIDKEVTGWIFFNGKVGIKGQPLMRDNKVMQWAGLSGALSGVASAAQYAQSVQSIGVNGAASVVPSSNIAPYAAYGGASKAADTLSQYYVKRAEQYHPVIQVGSGNVVTVVFKDGFYLEPDEDKQAHATHSSNISHQALTADDSSTDEMNFSVPPEVLGRIDKTRVQNYQGDAR